MLKTSKEIFYGMVALKKGKLIFARSVAVKYSLTGKEP